MKRVMEKWSHSSSLNDCLARKRTEGKWGRLNECKIRKCSSAHVCIDNPSILGLNLRMEESNGFICFICGYTLAQPNGVSISSIASNLSPFHPSKHSANI